MAMPSNAEGQTPKNWPEKVCPICKGTRFVHPLLAPGKPDYSRIVPCRCVEQESDNKRQSRLQNYSNLGTLTRSDVREFDSGWKGKRDGQSGAIPPGL